MKVVSIWQSAALVAALTASAWVNADWRVAEGSSVNYVSIKNNAVAENNVFTGITGRITDDGTIAIDIDLASVETRVGIRNQRMRDIFFEVADYPVALVRGQLSAADTAQLGAGTPLERKLPLTLSLHGSEVIVDAPLRAMAVGDEVYVSSLEPILLSTGDYGLAEGVAALQEIAGLKAISSTIPVTVNLRLVRE